MDLHRNIIIFMFSLIALELDSNRCQGIFINNKLALGYVYSCDYVILVVSGFRQMQSWKVSFRYRSDNVPSNQRWDALGRCGNNQC